MTVRHRVDHEQNHTELPGELRHVASVRAREAGRRCEESTTPDRCTTLIDIVDRVVAGRQLIVHCAAGIGRAGHLTSRT